jgi:uncharacterized FAD-dependent dehydrogenase
MSRLLPDTVTVELGLDEPDSTAELRARVARKLGLSSEELPRTELRKRSLDARGGRVRFHYTFALGERADEPPCPTLRETRGPAVLIVGDGPAGLFCAYELARHGVGSVILDRGKPIQPRRRDLKLLNQDGRVDADSNYCFGEGGAGTYSDGKLYTRAHKRGDVRDVLQILVRHGAPAEILVDARPHVGSNRLPKVVAALRAALEAAGVEFHFGRRVVGLRSRGESGARTVTGVRVADGTTVDARQVVLATGHSARDVYRMLLDEGIPLEAKSFAVGVRIEHPQPLINRIQYGASAGHPRLPPAAYNLASSVGQQRVFSFCMCPGGWIVPTATASGEVVLNGMSLSRRDSPFANSGLVVGIDPAELLAAGFDDTPLAGVELQQRLEQAAFRAGGGALRSPAQRATDFVAGRPSADLPKTSYIPGQEPASLGQVLDATGLSIASRLRRALARFDRQMRGYLCHEAVMLGVETRTSSPVRVLRDAKSLASPGLCGLYPCGEGAGYAGGIVSAALDGMRVARRIAEERERAS